MPARHRFGSLDETDYDDAAPRSTSRRRFASLNEDYDEVAPRTTSRRGLESPSGAGAGPPQIVALNETGRGPSRIGATLYQAPSPHSGFTATQNVVSTSAVRPVDREQVSVVAVVRVREHFDDRLTALASALALLNEAQAKDISSRPRLQSPRPRPNNLA